uniref:Putative von Willebrand domain containing protein n=1 Tax=viral metagenome TaxID=1070528 RepID=A0A6M3JW15_9ZZZZ
MGGGTYSSSHRDARLVTHFGTSDYYKTASPTEIFKAKTVNSAMNPHGVKIRESRDSKEHPNSLAILLALDVTGSMGSIPHFLVKEGLPDIMENIIKAGIKDPQLLFIGIGDHECDSAPLQVGQFESSDELLDKWLTDLFLEGGGGGNDGESYLLAWYFAAYHTAIDCFEKRKEKGFLFTIGDEPALKKVPKSMLKAIMGDGQYEEGSVSTLLDKAREKYNIYHIHMKQGSNGSREDVVDGWKQIIGKNLIIADKREEVSEIITDIIKKGSAKISSKVDSKKEDMLL